MVHCDICQAPMTMTGTPGVQVSFKCTKCEQCLGVDGEWGVSYTILHTLWPAYMDPDGDMFRNQYLPDWLRRRERNAVIMRCAGFWNESEAADHLAVSRKSYDNWFKDHPIKRPWWTFWRKNK